MLRQLAYGELDWVLETATRPLVSLGVLDRPLYAAYPVGAEEYVGTLDDVDDATRVARELLAAGYDRSGLLAALKYHPETGAPDAGSLRRVDPNHPTWQWHVHLFAVDAGVAIFSHYELRPDLHRIGEETRAEQLERLREHYRPEWSTTRGEGSYILGDHCDVVAELVG
jgi:hypothetical protein